MKTTKTKLAVRAMTLAVVAGLSMQASAPAYAGASGSIVYDPTNWAQNLRQAVTSVQQYNQQLQDYYLQLQHVRAVYENLRHFDPVRLAALMTANQSELAGVVGAMASAQQLGRTVTEVRNSLSARRDEARLSNMSWDRYLLMVKSQVDTNNQRQIYRIQREREIMGAVKTDFEIAREMSTKIHTTAGVQQSMGLMTEHLNRLISQQALANEQMARMLTQDDEKVERADNDKEQQLRALQDHRESHDAMSRAARSTFKIE